ncbi:hypothetical protein [Metapseudomonas otitidis]|uniref:hypothetical protein n=1 Tax=Metapseudomonas otitidis TaxID=319939 RepID=UPI000D1A2903|nr:hypothetical protein [Pseudomonas otitidis]
MIARDRNAARYRLEGGLLEFGRLWALDGDLIRCSACGRGHLASKAGEAFVHASDCAAAGDFQSHPWHDLAQLLRELPAVPA